MTEGVTYHVQWVKVEDSTVAPPAQLRVETAVSTNADDTAVRSAPSENATDLGALNADFSYPIQGSFWNPFYLVSGTQRCWWQIDLRGDASFQARDIGEGWVRNDVVGPGAGGRDHGLPGGGLLPDKGTEEPRQPENGCTPGPSAL